MSIAKITEPSPASPDSQLWDADECVHSPERDRQRELGQFLTPEPIADFMASLMPARDGVVRLLDAGAGRGALTAALVRKLCSDERKPSEISVTAYEVDTTVIQSLRDELSRCRDCCERAGVTFSFTIHNEDFIEAVIPTVRHELFASEMRLFNTAILNPPYRKIRADSDTRKRLRSAGIETGNLYAGFIALAMRLLATDGEMVAITPRSFCNGPYFRTFREDFLSQMSLRRLHIFESRSAAFDSDNVLQENIIFRAVKSDRQPQSVTISSSSGERGDVVRERAVNYHDVVSPSDPERFIHIVCDDQQAQAKTSLGTFPCALVDLGISVSTGRVVDFRAKEHLRKEPAGDTVPLIYPCHFNGGFVHWPKENGRKPNAIVHAEETRNLLVRSEIYVLVKRFTSKEERRRVVACIFDPRQVPCESVGFENHINYFHLNGRGLSMTFAKGLAAFLNSTLVDVCFRQFNGHTQVNATDLRNMRYPSRHQLESLGRLVDSYPPAQEELDSLIKREFNAAT